MAAGISAGLAYRFDLLALRDAFTLLRWAAYGGSAGAAISVLGVFRTWSVSRRKGLWISVLGLAAGLTAFWVPYSQYRMARELPAIHDITTDTTNPPRFKAVLALRGDSANRLDYGEAVSELQLEAYPDIQPLATALSRSEAFDAALVVAIKMGWRIVNSSPTEGYIEAVDTTRWFGFQDDVVVRLTSTKSGTRVDVRSASRVGVSDVGKNADRIRRYLNNLRSRVQE